MTRDIRGSGELQLGPVIGSGQDSQNWRNHVPNAGKAPKESIGIRTRTNITDGNSKLIDPNTGQPFGITTSIIHNLTDIESDWEVKMLLEPCFLCEHWRPDVFTLEEKQLLLKNLVREHGWTEEGVAKDIGDPRDYAYCEVDNTLSHRSASCPRNWSPKRTAARIFTGLFDGLGLGRKNRQHR